MTVAFKIPAAELDKREGKFIENWDNERKLYIMLLTLKSDS